MGESGGRERQVSAGQVRNNLCMMALAYWSEHFHGADARERHGSVTPMLLRVPGMRLNRLPGLRFGIQELCEREANQCPPTPASAPPHLPLQDREEEAQQAEQEEEDAFSPARCDVAFGSAHDGWAFRLDQFAAMYAQKLGCK
eukprot:1137061-Pelagomonas_calceolata.AAC.9